MKISKWVDMGAEVDIEIGIDDIREALAECFSKVTEERLDESPTIHDVAKAFNQIGAFLNAITDDQIALTTAGQRKTIGEYLLKASSRFVVQGRQS